MQIHELNRRSDARRGNANAASYEHHFDVARNAVKAFLPEPDSMSVDECRAALRRYTAAVTPNFVKWLAAASLSARSQDARYAASENVYVEIRDDHPGMLRALARGSGALPETSDYEQVEPFVALVQSQVTKMNGLFLTAMNGCIEHTSLDYVPWIARISERLGNTNMEYVDVHGEADISHAQQLTWALNKEAAMHDDPEPQISGACEVTVAFFRGVLLGGEPQHSISAP
jgi:hypothetical protein